jgi:hypothetical protein
LLGTVCCPGKLIKAVVEVVGYVCAWFSPRFVFEGFEVQGKEGLAIVFGYFVDFD